MSQHAIEDLVEDTIRLVDLSGDLSRKAALIRSLLDLQARYDTSLTWFRMHDLLLAHGVLERDPVDSIADTQARKRALAVDAPGWEQDEGGPSPAYIRIEDDTRVRYRLHNAVKPLPLPEAIQTVMILAEREGAIELMTDWYGLLVNGWIEAVLDAGSGFPRTLAGLSSEPELCAVREIAIRNGLKRRRGAPEDLRLPRLAEELSSANVEQEYALRFFLDLRKTLDALASAHAKAVARHRASAVLIPRLIEERLGTALAADGWRPTDGKPGKEWAWIRDVGDHRQFVWCDLMPELRALVCRFGLQHALLLHWERRGSSTAVHEVHFYCIASEFMPDNIRDSRKVGAFGGWHLDPARPEKTLVASVDELATLLPGAMAAWSGLVERSFPAPTFARDVDELLEVMENGVDGTGVVPEDMLFASPDSLLLAFAYHHLSNGDETQASALVDRVRARNAARPRQNEWIRRYLLPFLDAWAAGHRDPPMPPVLHSLLAMHLR